MHIPEFISLPWLQKKIYGDLSMKNRVKFNRKFKGTDGRHFTKEEEKRIEKIIKTAIKNM